MKNEDIKTESNILFYLGIYRLSKSYKMNGAVKCLQFDDTQLVMGINNEVIILDLKTGQYLSSLPQNGEVTALQLNNQKLIV
jgi:hypothetical protein